MTGRTQLLAAVAVLGLAGCMATDLAMREPPPQSVFREGAAYDAAGTVVRIERNHVTLAREGLPPMRLMVESATRVTLNGYQASVRSIPEGGIVRAKFQIVDDRAVAVSLDVKTEALAPAGQPEVPGAPKVTELPAEPPTSETPAGM